MKPRVDIKLDFLQKRQKINKNQKKKKTKARRIWVKAEFELWKVVF